MAYNIWRGLLALISALGSLAGLRLTLEHLQHGEVCPMLGPVPACIIVFLGYLAILIATIMIKKPSSKPIFYLGWTPVFLLALMGVILELTQGQICPPGFAGIPQCFFSLAIALICLGMFIIIKKSKTAAS